MDDFLDRLEALRKRKGRPTKPLVPISFKLSQNPLSCPGCSAQRWKVTYTCDGQTRSRDIEVETAQEAFDQLVGDPVFQGRLIKDVRIARYEKV